MRPILPIAFALAAPACGFEPHHLQDARGDVGIDSAPDTPGCVSSTQRPQLESLARGDLVIDGTQVFTTAPLVVPLNRSVLFTTVRENEASPQHGAVICDLRLQDAVAMTPAGVRCQRPVVGTDTPPSTGVIHVEWTVATFASGVAVQRGGVNTGFANPTIVTLNPPVDPATSFVLLGGMYTGGTGWGNNEFMRAVLVDAQSLEIRSAVAGSQAAWQVLTMSGAAVQRGTTTFAAADTSTATPVTSVPPDSLALASYTVDNSSSVASAKLMMQTTLTNGQSLNFKRGLSGVTFDISWEVVSLPFFSRTLTTDLAIGESTKTAAISNLPAATSTAIASSQGVLGQSSGSTDYDGAAVDLLGEAAVTLTLTDGMVAVERATSISNASVTWTAIDFAHDHCDAL